MDNRRMNPLWLALLAVAYLLGWAADKLDRRRTR